MGVIHVRLVRLVDVFMLSTSDAGGCNVWAISTANGCIYSTVFDGYLAKRKRLPAFF